MTDSPLWKIVVGKPLELADVIAAADETPAETGATAEVRGVELQRVDRTEGGTVAFVSSGAEGARVFARLLGKRAGDDAKFEEARAEDLAARDPIKA